LLWKDAFWGGVASEELLWKDAFWGGVASEELLWKDAFWGGVASGAGEGEGSYQVTSTYK
jgi:hypothetical protein